MLHDRLRHAASHTFWVSLSVVFTTSALAAQATGTPTFFAPTRAFETSEVGVSTSFIGSGAFAIEGRFGTSLDRSDLSFRVGYVEGGGGSGNFAAGAEARVPMIGHTQSFPFDGGLILGVGHIFASGGGQTLVPVGFSLGRRIRLDGDKLRLTPYIQPTVVFADNSLFAVGVGVDVAIGNAPEIRINAAGGDIDGFSISLFWAR